MPILRQPARSQGQDLARQPFHLDPGQHQEPALIDDELQIAFPLLHAPSDPGIAGRHHPCGTGKLRGSVPDLDRSLDLIKMLSVWHAKMQRTFGFCRVFSCSMA